MFSVKAPFLEDLFSFVEEDIEKYSLGFPQTILNHRIKESVYLKYEKKYFSRMTQTSIIKSVRTFIRLLFVSNDEEAIEYALGLYVILKCLMSYIDSKGLGALCAQDGIIQNNIEKIEKDSIDKNEIRKEALFIFICSSRWFCDEFKKIHYFRIL